MQDRFKFKVKFEIDGQVEIFDVIYISFESQQVFFRRQDNMVYNTGLGVKGVKLIQCTGLKDKNGKLIYEGDIVRFKDNVTIMGSKIHIASIEHNEAFNTFMYHAECMGLYTVNKAQNEKFNVEVIGNIYENPELLNDNQKRTENRKIEDYILND